MKVKLFLDENDLKNFACTKENPKNKCGWPILKSAI